MNLWLASIGDQPNLPEGDLIKQLWQQSEHHPSTAEPEIDSSDGEIVITCSTEGASIGYQILRSDNTKPASWSIYTAPFKVPSGSRVIVQAHRIGFKPSEIINYVSG